MPNPSSALPVIRTIVSPGGTQVSAGSASAVPTLPTTIATAPTATPTKYLLIDHSSSNLAPDHPVRPDARRGDGPAEAVVKSPVEGTDASRSCGRQAGSRACGPAVDRQGSGDLTREGGPVVNPIDPTSAG